MGVFDALAMVQAQASKNMKEDDREEFDGWMTCSWEQATEFLGVKALQDQDDRLMAARMIGLG